MTKTKLRDGVSLFWSPVLQLPIDVTQFMLRLFLRRLDDCLITFIPTTRERKSHKGRLLWRLSLLPMNLLGLVLLLFPAFAAFSFQCFVRQFRRSYVIDVGLEKRPWLEPCISSPKPLRNTAVYQSTGKGHTFSIATLNVCFLPDFLSHINNLGATSRRSKEIGERLVVDQFYYQDSMARQQQPTVWSHSRSRNPQTNGHQGPANVEILPHFPALDFVCVQETFDQGFTRPLIEELLKVYPWIVHDVGSTSHCLGFNSGLLFASKYEILNLDFKSFPTKAGTCKFVNKGLLMAKILVRQDGELLPRKVGYVMSTHLQAFNGTRDIIQRQLTDVQNWTLQFRRETEEQGEIVLFDVLCGDFNMDNMSPGEAGGQGHELFTDYVDVCRLRAGVDQDWTVGTEMRILNMLDEAVSTPGGLKQVMEDPLLRQYYFLDADLAETTMSAIYQTKPKLDVTGNIGPYAVGGRRRIDYILYRNESSLKVASYNFISRLAALTDHIPVTMTFTCTE